MSTRPTAAAAAIYARISRDRDGSEAGVRRQVQECRAWAERHQIAVAEVYEDNDISATSGKRRPEYQRMCEDIKHGTRNTVVTWHLDRLHRNPREMEDFITLIEATGANVFTVTGGDYDLGTSDGRAMARVVGAFARKESEDKSRRIKAQRIQQTHEGKRSWGGTRAYGYEPGHKKIVKAEAAVIKDAAKRILAGESLRSIVAALNERGVPTVGGKQWKMTVLRHILIAPRLSGQVEHLGEIVAQGDWPPILTPSETSRLRAILLDPTRQKNRTPRRYPLAGLVFCARCGAKMVARPRADGARRYYCAKGPDVTGCGKMAVIAEPLENMIRDTLFVILDSPEMRSAMTGAAALDDDAAEVQQEIDAAEARLEELATAYGNGEFELREWLAARKPIEARREDARKRMSRLSGSSALDGYVGHGDELRRQWGELSPARQRAIFGAVIHRIVIHPAVVGLNHFDPNRVSIEFRA